MVRRRLSKDVVYYRLDQANPNRYKDCMALDPQNGDPISIENAAIVMQSCGVLWWIGIKIVSNLFLIVLDIIIVSR